MIQFFNTLSGKIEEFKPLKGNEVGMYTCGPTVYDYAHIGNFRAFVFEDLLRRFLEYKGFKVKHVMNITDVDDKTIAGAKRLTPHPSLSPFKGERAAEQSPQGVGVRGEDALTRLNHFTGQYIEAFREDLQTLNILPANHPVEEPPRKIAFGNLGAGPRGETFCGPRATREIPAMIALIEKLDKKGVAYVSDGSVYYRVSAFPNYGKLSKKKLEQNIQGARVDVDEYEKEEGADFVLWKKAKEGEPSWDSPWGKGRPGWHIECSAMSMKYLGETFDIHAGGEDLVFPHHENEIAQSEGATEKKFVNYWLHCKFLLVNGEKMSKSKGNFYTLRDLLQKGYDPMAIRYALLSVHYRSPLNFTLQGLKEAGDAIKKLDECYGDCLSLSCCHGFDSSLPTTHNDTSAISLSERINNAVEGIEMSLEEDLNISSALSHLLIGVHFINQSLFQWKTNRKNLEFVLDFFRKMDKLFGLDVSDVGSVPREVIGMVKERDELRSRKDFPQTDALRNEINKQGWLVKDARPGESSTVKKKRRVWD